MLSVCVKKSICVFYVEEEKIRLIVLFPSAADKSSAHLSPMSYASRSGKYGAEHLSVTEKKIKVLDQHCEKTVGKRFFFQIDSDDRNKTISSHGKLSGHLQDLFFVDSFPYNDILNDEVAKSARNIVNKFKELLNELKHNSVKRKGVIKRLSLEFVKEFRQSGLRTTVTPYIHIIGNHLFEFDEFHDLGDYNM